MRSVDWALVGIVGSAILCGLLGLLFDAIRNARRRRRNRLQVKRMRGDREAWLSGDLTIDIPLGVTWTNPRGQQRYPHSMITPAGVRNYAPR